MPDAPDDENSAINIAGDYRFFIFNTGDNKKFAAMLRRKPRARF